jgi:fumarate hydratase class II
MSRIRFNRLSKELELQGSEPFIESNFYKIHHLIAKSLELKNKSQATTVKVERKSSSESKLKRPSINPAVGKQKSADVSQSRPATTNTVNQGSPQRQINRPPLKKYIRKVGLPGQEKIIIEVIEQRPKILSLEGLKERFGLLQSKAER